MWWTISIVVLLIGIAYQDFKQRAVSIVLFILLAILLLGLKLTENCWQDCYPDIIANILFLAFQMGGILIYFRIKEGQWGRIMDRKLGWGDIAFLLCILLYMPFLNFFIFHIISLIIALLIAVPNKNWRHPQKGIPLAGCQAVLFLGYFTSERMNWIDWDLIGQSFML
ncbi:hypothetical protein [Sphingobacterium paramultivorum]|uniref:hypothetical protein n=1 Tax=Sphingobacterium paramultivorum TaxID=2886510 RepID=UPI00129C481C|nr:hypothetical protein [Sphingobacterium paramultivorum]